MAHFIPSPDRMPYERQPRESDEAFKRFVLYRDAGTDRNYRTVADLVGVSPASIAQTAMKWGWRYRCGEWDRVLDAEARKAEMKAVSEMRTQHIKVAQQVWRLAAMELGRHAQVLTSKPPEDGPTMTLRDISMMVKLGTTMERVARGEPDMVTEHRVMATNEEARDRLRPLLTDPDAIDMLEALTNKVGGDDA